MTLRHVLQIIVLWQSAVIVFGVAVLGFEHVRELFRARQTDSLQSLLVDVVLIANALAAAVYISDDVSAASYILLPIFAVSCSSTVAVVLMRRQSIRARRDVYRRRNLRDELGRGPLRRRRDDVTLPR